MEVTDLSPSCHGARAEAFDGNVNLRIGAIFIIGTSTLATTLFPIVTRRLPKYRIPDYIFNFAKYFGSGVIIATAFIHLLAPGVEELSSPCLNEHFQAYPFGFAFSMIATFVFFFVELMTFRYGARLANELVRLPQNDGGQVETGNIMLDRRALHTSEDVEGHLNKTNSSRPVEFGSVEVAGNNDAVHDLPAAAGEILGVLILEFGVIFHSVIIGITLGTKNDFTTLFIVLIFHQAFEGLGLGSRLAVLPITEKSWIPYIGGLAYAIVTPVGIAIGLGVRHTYNGDSAVASYVTGTFDSISSGILLYTGLVELLAHEFIFNEDMRTAPLSNLLLNVSEMVLGAGLMALLGYWA